MFSKFIYVPVVICNKSRTSTATYFFLDIEKLLNSLAKNKLAKSFILVSHGPEEEITIINKLVPVEFHKWVGKRFLLLL